MIYLLKVNMLVAGAMFGMAGLFIAGLFVWTEAKNRVWLKSSRLTTPHPTN